MLGEIIYILHQQDEATFAKSEPSAAALMQALLAQSNQFGIKLWQSPQLEVHICNKQGKIITRIPITLTHTKIQQT